jgi:hypothetical protein
MYSKLKQLDIFQRPLFDIHRAWRAPLFRIVYRLSQRILEGTPVAEDHCVFAPPWLGRGVSIREVDFCCCASVSSGEQDRSRLLA